MRRDSTVVVFAIAAMAGCLTPTDAFVAPMTFVEHRKICSLSATTTETTIAEEIVLSPEFEAVYKGTSALLKEKIPSEKMRSVLEPFLYEYMKSASESVKYGNTDISPEEAARRFSMAVELGLKNGIPQSPDHFQFQVSHQAVREGPVDYYKFGDDFFRPAMDFRSSVVLGRDSFQEAFEYMEQGDNVIFLANHQSEADPQVMSILIREMLDKPQVENVVYIAGHKVTTDPLAVPFSMGRNLVCIHSKKYVDADPETKGEKSRQNLQAMSSMLDMLKKGGTAIWVAPSGGRDRRDLETGDVPIAPFDSKTVDMFRLMARKSKRPTHFYPLAMVSYDLCPPPDFTISNTGEARKIQFVPVGLYCANELSADDLTSDEKDAFAKEAFQRCQTAYDQLNQAIADKKQS